MKRLILVLGIAAFTFSCHKNTTTSKDKPADDMEQEPTTSSQNKPADNKMESSTTVVKTENVDVTEKKDDIKWMSYEEAVKESKKNPKKIFIDVYTDWCGWCKKMEKTTLKDPKVTEYMGSKFYAVKLNAESNKEIMYKGKKITEKQLASNIFKITGYPTTVYLEPNENLIQPIPGFMDAANLDKIMHYIGEDYYKTQTWEQFQMSYK